MRAGGTGGGGTGGGKGKGGGKRTARPFAPAEADGTGGAKKGREGQKGPRVTQKQVLQWLKVPSLEQPTAVAIANRRPCNRCLGQLQSPSQTAAPATAAWANCSCHRKPLLQPLLGLLRCCAASALNPRPGICPPPTPQAESAAVHGALASVRERLRRAKQVRADAAERQAGARALG